MSTPLSLYEQVCGSIGAHQTLPRHPFFSLYQPLMALRALASPRAAKELAPLLAPSGRAPLWSEGTGPYSLPNVALSCHLMAHWALLGKREAAEKLAGFLLPIVSEGLTTLWTREKEYKEDRSLKQLFHQSFEHSVESLVLEDPSIGYELSRGESAAIAITASGHQTSAGAARIGELAILAFGPHLAPLSDGELFGVGPGEDGWFCAHADKEIWLRARGRAENGCVSLSLESVGVQADQPLAFTFYLRADECRVDGRTFKPRSLARFSGTAEAVEWTAGNSKICFTTSPGLKLEVIPLAGDGDFWGASFLLAVWLPPFHATTSFRFF